MIMRMNDSFKPDWRCNIIRIIMCLRHYMWYTLTGVKECWRHSQELKPTKYGLTFKPSWPGKSQESSRLWEKRDSTTFRTFPTTEEAQRTFVAWSSLLYLHAEGFSGKLKDYGQTSLLNTSAAILNKQTSFEHGRHANSWLFP